LILLLVPSSDSTAARLIKIWQTPSSGFLARILSNVTQAAFARDHIYSADKVIFEV
jgi:hypothetical protein